LVEHFIRLHAGRAGRTIRGVDKRTLEMLQAYSWPGNVRELQNVIERSVLACDTEELSVEESWFPRQSAQAGPASEPFAGELVKQEREMIETALAETRGKVSGPSGAAGKLGLRPSTLESRIRSLKIDKHRFRPS
jgi:DNA-binding NtrC family response regulator